MANKEPTKPIESLYHYGILGMKWGVRRQVGSDGLVGSRGVIKSFLRKRSERQTQAKKERILKEKELDAAAVKRVNEEVAKMSPANKKAFAEYAEKELGDLDEIDKSFMSELYESVLSDFQERQVKQKVGSTEAKKERRSKVEETNEATFKRVDAEVAKMSPKDQKAFGEYVKQELGVLEKMVVNTPAAQQEGSRQTAGNVRLSVDDADLYELVLLEFQDAKHSGVDEVLVHYGILGMKWGIRRERGADGLVGTRRAKKISSEDHKKAQDQRKLAPKSLSTQDLQTLNKRLQLEKQYRDLDPNTYKKGMNIAKGIIAAGTTITAAYTFMESPAGKALKAALKGPAGKDILIGRV